MKQAIHPCIWFDGTAKEAANFYCSLFPNSQITVDTPMVVNFELEARKFMGLNGGPMFKLNPSISNFVICDSDAEIETLYKALLHGEPLMALGEYPWSKKYAWIKDKYGLTWQLMINTLPENTAKVKSSFLFSNKQYGKAKEAVTFYTQLFPNSGINHLELYGEGEPQAKGNVKFSEFKLTGAVFSAMDGPGDHQFEFNEAYSLVVTCDDQKELDHYWNSLISEGGEESMCGWLKDKYGVSWQIIPAVLPQLMGGPDRQKADRAMNALLKMKKLDIQKLQDAYDGK